MPDPDGFEENPQAPILDDDEENVIDEALFGPQKVLTAEEQASYDAWFKRQVEKALADSRKPDAIFFSHEEVVARMNERLERRIAKAQKREG